MLLSKYIKGLQKIIDKHGDQEIRKPSGLILKENEEMSYRLFTLGLSQDS